MLRFFVSLLGLMFLWRSIRNFFIYCFNVIFGRNRDLTAIYGENSYALITGGSEGIGKSIAFEFGKKGFNLILVARNIENLNKAKAELQSKLPNTIIDVISFDFSKITEPENFDIIQVLGLKTLKIDISIVVNNVGMSTGNFFENLGEEKIKQIIKVNCCSQVILTNQFARYFKQRPHKSAFIQTSSFSALKPFPFYDLYGATKIFNLFFSENIGPFDDQIDYYTFIPSYVSTKLNNYRKGFLVIQPEDAARAAMINIGSSRRVFCGHWKHEVFGLLIGFVPEQILGWECIRQKLYQTKLRGYVKET